MEPKDLKPVWPDIRKWLLFFTICTGISGLMLMIVNCQHHKNATVPKERTVHYEFDKTVDSFVNESKTKPEASFEKTKISAPDITSMEEIQIEDNDSPSTEYSKNFTVPSINKIITMPGDDNNSSTDEIYYKAEEMPKFNGERYESFRDWIAAKVQYPEIAAENGITGRVVIQFAINITGNVCDVIVVKGVDPCLDQEAIRVISSSPKWTPGKIKGHPVKVQFNFPVFFDLK